MSLGVHLLNQAAIIMRPSRLVSVIAAAAALLPAERGAAQDSGVPAASAQPAQGLEEVIVTAQKRPENIQTVPVSIVAFSAEGLRQLGMMEGFDLANQVPNMNIDAPVSDSNVRYFIRGVGTQDFNTLATSPIALYIDDVYLGSTIANSLTLYGQPIAAGSPLSIESNAGKATDRGGEIELKLVPEAGWLISGAVGYVHAIFIRHH
jgi:outer membrane receptor protein involved in Fe transport